MYFDAPEGKKRLEDWLLNWISILAIVGGGAWAVAYTFYYKEIFAPKSAPINVGMNLSLKKIELSPLKRKKDEQTLVSIEMDFSAMNPSSRVVHLLPSSWVAWGHNIQFEDRDENEFIAAVNKKINDNDDAAYFEGRYYKTEKITVVAAGKLFLDTELEPMEKINRTLTFEVPKGKFDKVEVCANMPMIDDSTKLKIDWSLDKDGLNRNGYRLNKDGTTGKAINLEDKNDKKFLDDLNFGTSQTMSFISLLDDK